MAATINETNITGVGQSLGVDANGIWQVQSWSRTTKQDVPLENNPRRNVFDARTGFGSRARGEPIGSVKDERNPASCNIGIWGWRVAFLGRVCKTCHVQSLNPCRRRGHCDLPQSWRSPDFPCSYIPQEKSFIYSELRNFTLYALCKPGAGSSVGGGWCGGFDTANGRLPREALQIRPCHKTSTRFNPTP